MEIASLAAVHGFLKRLLDDRQRGRERTLADYQLEFPGFEQEIGRAWNELSERKPLGRFRIERQLGQGGQGTVHLAWDPVLKRDVALKLLDSPFAGDSDALRRFRREAEAASRISHPGVCAVHEFGEHEGRPYIVMQYVEGENLSARLARERGGDAAGALTAHARVDWASSLVERVARAVHAAHEAHVIHRDLKPGNIALLPSGEPVVLDFGLARDDIDEAASLTRTGDSFGTPAYMAPEQIQPDGRSADRRTDVYALGVVLYECLALRRPFEAATRTALARAILEEQPARLRTVCPAVPRELEIVVETALARHPHDRYQSAADLADELARVREQRPILARPAGVGLRVLRWVQRNRRLAAALVGLFGALLVTLVVTTYHLVQSQASIAHIQLLSDVRIEPFLRQQEQVELWPATPDRVPAIDAWLAEAGALAGRISGYRESIDALKGRPTRSPAEEEILGQLSPLVGALRDLDARLERMRRRREQAATLEQRSLVGPSAEWELVVADLADARRSPRYGGLVLRPQLGLLPLGRDPRSDLFEFCVLDTGEIPRRDATSGALAIDETSAIVLVLLPGGRFRMGADGKDAIDLPDATPSIEVELAPWFHSKYELTQGQWIRATGNNPSNCAPGSHHGRYPTGATLANPVEDVSWEDCVETLRRIALVLPSEAQWECACRGGATTRYYTGDSVDSLRGHANLADEGSRDKFTLGWAFEPGIDDGYIVHAPVGSFLPNAFGLHDMHGNVTEWCLDGWTNYGGPRQPGDGACLDGAPASRIYRGGNYNSPALFCSCAGRAADRPWMRSRLTGVRPARPVR